MSDYTIGLAVPIWIALLIVAAGFGFAFFAYSRTLPPVPPARRWTLILLRTLGIGLLLLALLEPVISLLTVQAEPPQVFTAVDQSQSMSLGGTTDTVRIAEARRIAEQLRASSLGEQTIFSTFADSAQALPSDIPFDTLQAHGGETRMEAPFALAADSLRSRNIRAIVVMTDGRYNAGVNPLFEAENLGIPVFAVGLGDSVEPKDLSVQELFTNEIAYVGAELPVEVRVKSAGFGGGAATVTLSDDNGVVAVRNVTLAPGTNEYTTEFVYTPKNEGIAKLRAVITGGEDELTDKNNSRTAFIKVKSNRRRYVLVAGAPSPDVAFLKRILSRDREVEIKSFIQKQNEEFLEGKLSPGDFREAEAVILVNFPTAGSPDEAVRTIRTAVSGAGLPLLLVTGPNLDFGRIKELDALLPVTFSQPRPNEMQVFVDLTEPGENSPITRLATPEEWETLPPIYRTETSVTAKPEASVLARARIGKTRLDEPLIVSRKLGRTRSLAILGYGIYRWELLGEGPREARGEAGSNLLENFVGNSLRWLATREQEKQVRIVSNKQLYNLGEPVRLLAQVYDESYLPLSGADVQVRVRGPEKTYPITLAPAGNGRYEGTLSNLPSGDYSFTGTALFNDRELGSDGGRFTIGEISIEFLQPSMHVDLLRALATRTGGRFFTADQADQIADAISSHPGFGPRTVENRSDVALWNLPWLLAIALAAFTVEWIIRKRSGML